VDLTPVYTQVAKLTPPSIRFKAWDWLATFEFGREKFTAARLASQEAWKHVAPGDLMAFGVTTTRTFWSMRQELSKRDIAFMLSMSKDALASARSTLVLPDVPTPMAPKAPKKANSAPSPNSPVPSTLSPWPNSSPATRNAPCS
jgi:hypothetical protein